MDSKIVVLMSTYNGEKYVETQINSILNQKGVDLIILIRDDGSKDKTVKILNRLQQIHSKKIILLPEDSKNYGAANSFMYLLEYALRNFSREYEYFSFADQDDYWLEEKLKYAVDCIKNLDTPALYYSKKKIVDDNLNEIYQTDDFLYEDSFLQYFAINNASGCTFLFNWKLGEMCKQKPQERCIYHDAWIYRVAACTKSTIVRDSNAYILYRQHDKNLVGKVEYWNIFRGIKCLFRKRNHVLQKTFNTIYDRYKGNLNSEAEILLPLIYCYNKSFYIRLKLLNWKEAYKYGLKAYIIWFGKVLFNGI